MKRLAGLAALLVLGACASGAVKTPVGPPTAVAQRLQQEMVSANRWRLTYIAPPNMAAAEAKDRAMLGAAKLTIDKGNTWFEVADTASGQHSESIEIVMGKGESLAGGKNKQYDAKETYARLSGKYGANS